MLSFKRNVIKLVVVALALQILVFTVESRSLSNGNDNGNGNGSGPSNGAATNNDNNHHHSQNGHGNNNNNNNTITRRNGRWQSIDIVGECANQTLFEECYNCGKDADSTDIYSSCCHRVPEIVQICSGNFSDE